MKDYKKQLIFQYLFLGLILIFVFQNPLQRVISPLKYLDEMYALLSVPLCGYVIIRNNYRLFIPWKYVILIILLGLFLLSGMSGWVNNRYQSLTVTLSDAVLNIKFYLAIGTSVFLFREVHMGEIYKKSWNLLRMITGGITALLMADLVLHFFEAEIRSGLRAEQLFYTTHTYLAAACSLLVIVFFRFYQFYREKTFPWICMLWFDILCTLRIKAIGAVFVMFFIYMIICRKRRNISLLTWGIIGGGVLLMATQQFNYYFHNVRDEAARSVLLRTSLKIAQDFFPLGSGFGTFASAVSAEPYSKIYYMYHIQNVWGLSKDHPIFISDSFWPMLLGQCGYLGLLIYLLILGILIWLVFDTRRRNAWVYASGLTVLVYLGISSVGESAFVNTYAVGYAFILGILLSEHSEEDFGREEKEDGT